MYLYNNVGLKYIMLLTEYFFLTGHNNVGVQSGRSLQTGHSVSAHVYMNTYRNLQTFLKFSTGTRLVLTAY